MRRHAVDDLRVADQLEHRELGRPVDVVVGDGVLVALDRGDDQPVDPARVGELTAALLHGPEVLFLDEPTIGLDVVSKQAVRAFLASLGATGDTTIVLTTHDLADIERLCRRLVVIDHGVIIAEGTAAQLKERLGGTVIELSMRDEAEIGKASSIVQPIVGAVPEVEGKLLRVPSPDGSHLLAQMLRQLDEQGVFPATVSLREPSLDDVFLALTGHAAEDPSSEQGGAR